MDLRVGPSLKISHYPAMFAGHSGDIIVLVCHVIPFFLFPLFCSCFTVALQISILQTRFFIMPISLLLNMT